MVSVRRIPIDDELYWHQCALRQAVLFDHIGYDMEMLNADFPGREERAEHFVALSDHHERFRLIGCASLLHDASSPARAQLIQMAVDRQRQGRGVGRMIVTAVTQRAFDELGAEELYCHARHGAYGFYTKLGWRFDSGTFDELGGEHRRMVLPR